MDFSSAVVNGIPLLIIIAGLVQFAEKFGIKGRTQLVLSMGLGIAFGLAFELQSGLPADFAGWFGVFVYGLGLGLTTSGLYDLGKKYSQK